MPIDTAFTPERIHLELGDAFYDAVLPARFPAHIVRYRNQRAAVDIGLGSLNESEWIAHFGRFEPLPGSLESPLALRYHGHQFRSYNPHLGDGRGFLFAQMHDGAGRILDLATKGSGETPWSRRGDGRLTLKGGLREVLATEMLEALGVTTSRSFSLIETGEGLERHDEPSPTRSSVLVRLGHSHIRIGTFQRLAALKDVPALERLLEHLATHYLTELMPLDRGARALAFFRIACERISLMAAQWMAAGFVHGVLNSDNINVLGESFDYGPWRFAPTYDPNFVAAYYDETGLYAFGRQPSAVAWTLARLAECLLPFASVEALTAILDEVGPMMQAAFAAQTLRRLGLCPQGETRDAALATALARFMIETQAPFEQVYFDWYGGRLSAARAQQSPASAHYAAPAFEPVRQALAGYEARNDARLDHAYFAHDEPCTMLIDELEDIWDAIAANDDWRPFEAKLAAIAEMRQAYGRDD